MAASTMASKSGQAFALVLVLLAMADLPSPCNTAGGKGCMVAADCGQVIRGEPKTASEEYIVHQRDGVPQQPGAKSGTDLFADSDECVFVLTDKFNGWNGEQIRLARFDLEHAASV